MVSLNLLQIQSSDSIFASWGDLFKNNIGKVVGATSFLAALVSIKLKNKMKKYGKRK
jgi:hypothetical protein